MGSSDYLVDSTFKYYFIAYAIGTSTLALKHDDSTIEQVEIRQHFSYYQTSTLNL